MNHFQFRARIALGILAALAGAAICFGAKKPAAESSPLVPPAPLSVKTPVVVDVPATATKALDDAATRTTVNTLSTSPSLTLPKKKSAATTRTLDFTLETTRPLSVRFGHEIDYDPAGNKLNIVLSNWNVDQLALRIFDGRLESIAQGKIEQDEVTDVATSITLQSMDIQKLLEFLEVPRARELEAKISGVLRVEMSEGDWRRVDVDLSGDEGSVRISREILRDLLAPAFGGGMDSKALNATLDQFFKNQSMIPLTGLRVTGTMREGTLRLRLPLHNEALNIDFEPNVDRRILWSVWRVLHQKGAEGLLGANWNFNMDSKRIPNPK